MLKLSALLASQVMSADLQALKHHQLAKLVTDAQKATLLLMWTSARLVITVPPILVTIWNALGVLSLVVLVRHNALLQMLVIMFLTRSRALNHSVMLATSACKVKRCRDLALWVKHPLQVL